MRGNSQNGGQTTKSLLTKPQCSGVPIQQAVSLSSSFPRHCLLFVCAFFRKMQAGARSEELSLPPPPAYKTAPASCCGNRGGSFALWVLFSGARAKPCEGSFGKPRVCGEKTYTRPCQRSSVGSPPHVRGKVCGIHSPAPVCGITPAYAGKRRCADLTAAAPRDHPRVCGEKLLSFTGCCRGEGSPPRMRGKDGEDDNRPQSFRITPAYAGKRLKRSRSTVSPVAIVPLFPSVCNKPVVSDGSPASPPSQFPPRITVISPRP